MTGRELLYGVLAEHYDQIYHWKDYKAEAAKIRQLVRREARVRVTSLLDVGCGTGRHIEYLKRSFDCVGLDFSEQMLEVARKNVPGVEFVRGNMVDFDLGRRFGAVTCLFSAIGHLQTRKQVSGAVKNFASHLESGGVVLIEPWLAKSGWTDGHIGLHPYQGDEVKIARLNYVWSEGNFSVIDFRYLIAEKGKGLTYLKEVQRLRFFEKIETLRAMREAGLEARFVKDSLMPGRGLLIGVKA